MGKLLLRPSEEDEFSSEGYLFHTFDGDIAFVILEEEMSQLNDFCYLFLSAAEKKVEDIQLEIKQFKANSHKEIPESNGLTYGDLVFYKEDFELPAWKDTYSFLAMANCVLLLHTFTEKSLKTLCEYLGSSPKTPTQLKGKSKIDSYLSFLQSEYSLDFEIDKEIYGLMNTSRSIRNDFAHGEWDKLRSTLKNIDLQDSFGVVTGLFYSIEKSYESKQKK